MNSKLFYKVMSGFYDLLDVIYFRKYESSPRKVVFGKRSIASILTTKSNRLFIAVALVVFFCSFPEG